MPKTISELVRTQIGQQYGVEPYIVVEIDWYRGKGIYRYSDKSIDGAEPKVLSISGLDATVKINSSGITGNITIALDDSDSVLKSIIDANDIVKCYCAVKQYFTGVEDSITLFYGQIISPIEYSNNVLSITISSEIEDTEIGFSPEQYAFQFLSPAAIGKAWPIVFGSVLRVPTVKVTENIRGTCMTRYNLMSVSDLSQLWNLGYSFAKALRDKELYELNSMHIDATMTQDKITELYNQYNTVINELGSAINEILQFEDQLIIQYPEMELAIFTYLGLARNIQYLEIIRTEMQNVLQQLVGKKREYEVRIETIGKDLATYRKALAEEEAKQQKNQDEIKRLKNQIKDLESELPRVQKYLKQTIKNINNDAGNDKLEADHWYTKTDTDTWLNYSFEYLVNTLYLLLQPSLELDVPGILQRIVWVTNTLLYAYQGITVLYSYMLQLHVDKITIDGGEQFPQDEYVEILLNNARFGGYFYKVAGKPTNVFTITNKMLPTKQYIQFADRGDPLPNHFWLKEAIDLRNMFCLVHYEDDKTDYDKVVYVTDQKGQRCAFNTVMWTDAEKDQAINKKQIANLGPNENYQIYIREICPFLPYKWLSPDEEAGNIKDMISGSAYMPDVHWGMDIGDTVYFGGDYKELYVISLNQIAEVKDVLAFRSVHGVKKLLPVPSRYYEKQLALKVGNRTVSALVLPRLLSSYADENWDDDIYVSVKETNIGSNTVDIIKALVEAYTNFTCDETSFNAVKTKLAKYPSHFAILEKKQVLQIIEEIAWQARCALFISNKVVYIKYLAAEEDEVLTITDADIEFGTISTNYGDTDDIVTKFIATWKPTQQQTGYQLILRNNIQKYGTQEQQHDFYIYNMESLVKKSATFWMLRYSSCWKRIKFKGMLRLLELNPMDTVKLNIKNNPISTDPVKCIVENIGYDPKDFSVSLSLWTPVRAGSMTPYVFAWPATASAEAIYPTVDDKFAGSPEAFNEL